MTSSSLTVVSIKTHLPNTLRPRQNGHFADNIFKSISMYKACFVYWLKYPWNLFHNPALVLNIARRLIGNNLMNQWWPSLPTCSCVNRPEYINWDITYSRDAVWPFDISPKTSAFKKTVSTHPGISDTKHHVLNFMWNMILENKLDT